MSRTREDTSRFTPRAKAPVRVKGQDSPLLPREDARDIGLFLVVAVIAFLAALAALSARAATGAAETWAAGLNSEISVRLRGTELTDADTERARALILQTPGVMTANTLDRAEAEALLSPWLGTGGLPDDIALPKLLEVSVTPGEAARIAGQIDRVLIGAGFNVVVDAYGLWAEDVRATAQGVQAIALGILVLLCVAGVAVIASATHAAMLARRDIIEALHLVGARDGFIAGQFQARFLALGLKAGGVGALLAGLTLSFLMFTARRTEANSFLLPQITPSLLDLGVLLLTPLFAGMVAMIAARIAAMTTLKDKA
jgi:cell division transport system permease protein